MKNIITAIGDEKLNNILSKYENINVLYKDIQYEEGVLETLNIENKVDLLIISDEILIKKNIYEIVQEINLKIKNVEIIIISSKEKEDENIYKIENIKKIIFKDNYYINNTLSYILENKDRFINKIEKDNILIDDEKEEKKINIINKIMNKFKKNKQNNIFTVLGSSGVGKTIFIGILSKIYAEKGYKVLLIDLDFDYKNLHILFRTKKYPKTIYKKLYSEEFVNEFKLNENNLDELKVKISKNLYLISSVDIIFDGDYKINNDKINNLFRNLKEKYNIILIDTNSEKNLNIMQTIIDNSDKVLYLVENSLLQLNKSKQRLFKYIEDYKIEKRKINIICNKKEGIQNNKDILKIIFKKIKIIGFISYSKEYRTLINSNLKNEISKTIKKEYEKIIDRLIWKGNN